MSTRYASIDIGSNSVLLLIGQPEGRHVHRVYEECRVTRLGENAFPNGRIIPEAMERTLSVLERYLEMARRFRVAEIVCTGTQVFRKATNADEFIRRVKQRLGISIRVLDPREEAVLTFVGALDSLTEPPTRIWAIDIGGGSTELVLGNARRIEYHGSLDVGGVQLQSGFRLNERLGEDVIQRLRAYVQHHLKPLKRLPRAEGLVGIGGTLTSLAALAQSLRRYDFHKIDGFVLTKPGIARMFEQMNRLRLREREQLPGMEPGRADIILPATLILLEALKTLGHSRVIVSARGLRFGVLLWRLGGVQLSKLVGETS